MRVTHALLLAAGLAVVSQPVWAECLPLSEFTKQLAAKYQCEVSMVRNGRRVNAKSIMGVMMLAAGKGARVTLETDGPDEVEALDSLVALIGECFGEGQ